MPALVKATTFSRRACGATWTVIIPAETAAFDLSTDCALGEPEAVRDGLLAEMARMGVDDGEHEEISTRAEGI